MLADEYRKLATQFRDHACNAGDPALKAEWEGLAQCYELAAEDCARSTPRPALE